MIRNRSQKFWDIYQGYPMNFKQGEEEATMKFIALLLLFPCIALSISILDCSVVGDGSDEDRPLEEGTLCYIILRRC